MSRTHLILLATLIGVAIVPSAEAQTAADSAAPDSLALVAPSATADTVVPAPKKKGGGLFGKVRKIAGNKTVKGIAKGVACNAVPGAAVAAAAAGSKACPAGGLMGGMPGSGGVTGALGGAVGGAIGASAAPNLDPAATGGAMSGMIPNGGDAAGMAAMMSQMTGMMNAAGGLAGTPDMSALGNIAALPPGMKLNEPAAAKCLGISVKELRDVMSVTPNPAQLKRAEAVKEKMMKRELAGARPTDMQACATAWQPSK